VTALLDERENLEVEPTLRELHIPSSTYYRWRRAKKEPCERRRRDTELTGQIQQIHADSGGIYGSPRVHAVLKREGVHVGRKRVERLMREAGSASRSAANSPFAASSPASLPGCGPYRYPLASGARCPAPRDGWIPVDAAHACPGATVPGGRHFRVHHAAGFSPTDTARPLRGICQRGWGFLSASACFWVRCRLAATVRGSFRAPFRRSGRSSRRPGSPLACLSG
jgi:hypothetical protein